MISILTDSKEVKVEERGRDAYWKWGLRGNGRADHIQ
jgi:hypothetical protein